MPASLPMLPGNVYADPTVTRYHKTQLLGVKDNTIVGKWSHLRCQSLSFIWILRQRLMFDRYKIIEMSHHLYLCSLNCREDCHLERARRPIYSDLHAWGSAPEPHWSAAPSRPIERRHPKGRSQVAETRSSGKDLLHIFLYVHHTWHPGRAGGARGRCRSLLAHLLFTLFFLDFIYYTSVADGCLVLNYRDLDLSASIVFFEWFP